MNHLSTLPLLEMLRAPPGWRTDRALLSTYSADPAVLVALLLALSGRDDDAGSGSKVALARALNELKDRVVFVLQRGRVAAPRKAPKILALFDRFIREVPWDEGDSAEQRGRSWHAKLALVRRVAEDDPDTQTQWRFWIGSRNFTRDTSWDIGLSLESAATDSSRGQLLPGIETVAARLAEQAGVGKTWEPLASELAEVEWHFPRGLTVEELTLMLPGDTRRDLPPPPSRLTRLFAVAPFLDGQTVHKLGSWQAEERTLLSTIPELGRIATQRAKPLASFELLALPAAPEDSETSPEDEASTSEASLDSRGLHAKMLWAEHTGGATLWLGSPNLTARGWRQNAEAFVMLDVARRGRESAKELYEGIEAFRSIARPVRPDELENVVSEDAIEEALETAHRQVAARLSGHQRRSASGEIALEPIKPPHPDDPQIKLEVARLGGPFVFWPRETTSLIFPMLEGAPDSDLLVLRVSLRDKSLVWTQLVPFDPPHSEQRDLRVLREYLGARGYLLWIRNVLDDATEDGGLGAWDEEKSDRPGIGHLARTLNIEFPTLEQVLRAWLRNPDRLQTVDSILRTASNQPRAADDDEVSVRHLDAFVRSWKILSASLMEGRGRGS
jgi:hypothetical protein